MKRFSRDSQQVKKIKRYAKIFQISVAEDADEIGIVLAIPEDEDSESITVRGERKVFDTEQEKLDFLAKAKAKGFQNFTSYNGTLDAENMVLSELARRQKKHGKFTAELDSQKRKIEIKNFL